MHTNRIQPCMTLIRMNIFLMKRMGELKLSNESKYFTVNQYNFTFNNSSTYINSMVFNIRSWNKNGDKFSSLLNSLNSLPQILVLPETWLSIGEQNTCLLDGYTKYHTVPYWERGGRCRCCAWTIEAREAYHV